MSEETSEVAVIYSFRTPPTLDDVDSSVPHPMTKTHFRASGRSTHENRPTAEDQTSDTETDRTETDRTETDRTETDAATSESIDAETTACPECGSTLRNEGAETVCSSCGLVVDADEIDRGPEWRAFDASEKDSKSRVGAPTTKMMHDDGLSTNIGWQDKDAYGNALSSNQRQKMQRLRTWNERFRTRDSKERNLKQALGEIDRMASALGLPENVRETASVIYRQALNNDMLPGRSIEGIATASLQAAARMEQVPRSIDEIAAVSRVDAEEFKRAYRYINRELKLEIQPADPIEYLPRFASDLAVPDETEQFARQLLEQGKRQNVHSGKSPVGLAAAAIYAAGKLTNVDLTQSEVSDATGMSEVTIRNRYQELLEAEEARFPGVAEGDADAAA